MSSSTENCTALEEETKKTTQTHAVIDLREIIKIVGENVLAAPVCQDSKSPFFPTPQNAKAGTINHCQPSISCSPSFSALSAPVSPVGTTIQE